MKPSLRKRGGSKHLTILVVCACHSNPEANKPADPAPSGASKREMASSMLQSRPECGQNLLQARALAATNDALSAQLSGCSRGSGATAAGPPSDCRSPPAPSLSNGHRDGWGRGAAEEAALQGQPATDDSDQRGAQNSRITHMTLTKTTIRLMPRSQQIIEQVNVDKKIDEINQTYNSETFQPKNCHAGCSGQFCNTRFTQEMNIASDTHEGAALQCASGHPGRTAVLQLLRIPHSLRRAATSPHQAACALDSVQATQHNMTCNNEYVDD